MKRCFGLVFILLFMLSGSLVLEPAQAALSWNAQKLKEYVWVGGERPIVIDSCNVTHIAYMDGDVNSTGLVYASYNGKSWINQTVASDAVYRIFSLVLDKRDYPHILFEENFGAPLIIANWNGQTWEYQQTGVQIVELASLALDSSDKPSLVYARATGGEWDGNWIAPIKYAKWTGTIWINQTVDVVHDKLRSLSFTLSRNDTPYILYTPFSNQSLTKLAYRQDSCWKVETAQLFPNASSCGNIVVDSNSQAHFVYINTTNKDTIDEKNNILYATYNQTWSTQTVASEGRLGKIGPLALDSKDNPQFTYSTNDGLSKYSKYSQGIWQTVVLPAGVGVGDLAIDSDGNPRLLSCADSARFCYSLTYATGKEASPTVDAQEVSDLQVYLVIAAVAVIIVAVILFSRIHRADSRRGNAVQPQFREQ